MQGHRAGVSEYQLPKYRRCSSWSAGNHRQTVDRWIVEREFRPDIGLSRQVPLGADIWTRHTGSQAGALAWAWSLRNHGRIRRCRLGVGWTSGWSRPRKAGFDWAFGFSETHRVGALASVPWRDWCSEREDQETANTGTEGWWDLCGPGWCDRRGADAGRVRASSTAIRSAAWRNSCRRQSTGRLESTEESRAGGGDSVSEGARNSRLGFIMQEWTTRLHRALFLDRFDPRLAGTHRLLRGECVFRCLCPVEEYWRWHLYGCDQLGRLGRSRHGHELNAEFWCTEQGIFCGRHALVRRRRSVGPDLVRRLATGSRLGRGLAVACQAARCAYGGNVARKTQTRSHNSLNACATSFENPICCSAQWSRADHRRHLANVAWNRSDRSRRQLLRIGWRLDPEHSDNRACQPGRCATNTQAGLRAPDDCGTCGCCRQG